MRRLLLVALLAVSAGAETRPVTAARLGAYAAGGQGLWAPTPVWAADAARAKAAGIGIVRFNTDTWDLLEPKEGAYDWSRLDAAVDALAKEGIDVLFTLPISNSRNTPQKAALKVKGSVRARGKVIQAEGTVGPTHFPTKDMDALKRLARAAAARYKGRIRFYEVWNEPDFALFWKGAPDAAEYAALLKAVVPEIRAADPGAVVLMGGLAFPAEPAWLDAFLAQGTAPFFDAFNVHVYPSFATLDEALSNVRAVAEKHGVRKPVWITETSSTGGHFDSKDRGAEERRKAGYLVKTYAQALSDPGVEKVFWHTLRNPGKDVRLPRDFDFGLMTGAGEPLPAHKAHQVLSGLLSGAVPKGREGADPRVRIYAFVKDGRTVYVGWTLRGRAQHRLRAPGFRARRVSALGERRDMGPADDLRVDLEEEPFYVELEPQGRGKGNSPEVSP